VSTKAAIALVKKALIVLALEVAVLAIVVVAFLRSEGPVVSPPVIQQRPVPPARARAFVAIALSAGHTGIGGRLLSHGGHSGSPGVPASVALKSTATP
jgi:hypothetical protein